MPDLDFVADSLPRRYPGPGGACAVLRHGHVLVRHAWGWANAERRIAFTPHTLFRICSITKQFTCATVLDACPDPSALDGKVRALLPHLSGVVPGALHLCHNQSGLRDYWAVAMLHGAPAESPFGDAEAAQVISATRSLQFAPGTRYSYANQNFRLLSDCVQTHTGRGFAELLRTRIFDRAGMGSAILAADTAAMPDGTLGYEGTPAQGYRAAENRILWTGDAGIGASLDDMIAWERFIDASRDDDRALPRRLAEPVHFADGAPAVYGFGLGRRPELGLAATGHGGALRGWRSHRVYFPAERLSVIVFFNHLTDAHEAAMDLARAALRITVPPHEAVQMPHWLGAYLEPETGLSARLDAADAGQIRLRYGHSAETLTLRADGSAGNDATTLTQTEHGLRMDRPGENQSSILASCQPGTGAGIAGRYRCDELHIDITIVDAGGAHYGAFSGFLGQGRMELLEPVADGVWTLPCWRALDHTPPGRVDVAVWTRRHRLRGTCGVRLLVGARVAGLSFELRQGIGKQSFFQKKDQKTFVTLHHARRSAPGLLSLGAVVTRRQFVLSNELIRKSFLVLFFKKELLILSCLTLP